MTDSKTYVKGGNKNFAAKYLGVSEFLFTFAIVLRLLLLILTLLFLLPCHGKEACRYRNITMNNGLAANGVRNIVQDKEGFIWFGTDNGLCRYDGTQILPYRIAELGINQYVSALLACDEGIYVGTEKGVFWLERISGKEPLFTRLPLDIHSVVTQLALDKEGNLWVSTMENGVWLYIKKSRQAKQYQLNGGLMAVAEVFVDSDNQIWAITNWGHPPIQRLNRLHDRFEPINLSYDGSYSGLRMLQTRDGRMWIGSWEDGLLLMHADGRLEQVLDPKQTKIGNHIHTLFQRSDDCICIGCDDGIVCFNPKTMEYKQLFDGLQIPQGWQPARFVYAVTSDREGGLWIGTFYGGVYYVSPVGKRFEAFSVGTGLAGNVISRFCEDKHGRIWIASDDGGLMCYCPKERCFVDYPHRNLLSQQNAHALSFCGDELWVGTYTNGVMVLNIESGSLSQHKQTGDPRSPANASCYAICIDKRTQVWVGTMGGVSLYDRTKNTFESIVKTDAMVIDIDEDSQGNLWVSTQGNGLWRYSPKDKKVTQYLYSEKDGHSLPDNQVNCTLVDEGGRVWIGTLNGLCRYNTEKGYFERVRLEVPTRNIVGIIEDNGALWLSTDRGIVKYEPQQSATAHLSGENVQRFTLHDGLVSEQFQPNSVLKASDGRIYFGSTNGFNAFLPYQIKANGVMPPVYVTSVSILNREEHTATGVPLDLSQAKELELGYSDARMLTFTFASLSYCSPEKNQYAYKLDGFDADWNYVGNQSHATYTNLPAGTYEFKVKATNNDGIWSANEATLRIVIHPPFWWSWYAKIFYLLIVCYIVWLYVHYRLKMAERQHQQEIERLNAAKEKEVREARLNFFTMIAHEIRTPVSLIIGPLEKMMKKGSPSDDMRVIDRNARRLLELVNQLLDFRKVEQRRFVMHFAAQNIYELMQSVCERFVPTFEQGGKRFIVDYPDKHFTAVVDKEAVTKVVSNLLTNANKYTKDDVRLTCVVEPDGRFFRITVSDNGIGIHEEDRQRIFEPFYQAEDNKPGTGIGLNIVKNIIEQHHGTITVESEVGKGSTFTVVLPVMQKDIVEIETQNSVIEDVEKQVSSDAVHHPALSAGLSPSSSLPVMLIVDDSEDMVSFLSDNFRNTYEVVTAGDGIEALDLLRKHETSIIISDWMMPRMDGADFCRHVRRDPQTSHIPFVMLTAKTDNDSKIQGMNIGADTYIEKPFSLQYLEACIHNILQMRRHLMEKFSTHPLKPVTEIAQNPTDNEFLTRMTKVIEENFSNSELNVNFLAEQLNISRSGLFAKIKSLADITPNEMIQIVRLKKAAQLLQKKKYTVSEISYMVGFSSPSYFSKCFQKQFGMKPANFAG